MTCHQHSSTGSQSVPDLTKPLRPPRSHCVEVHAALTYDSPDSHPAEGVPEARVTRLWIDARDLRVMHALGPTATIRVLAAPRPDCGFDGAGETERRPQTPATISIDLQTAATGREIVPGWGIRRRRLITLA